MMFLRVKHSMLPKMEVGRKLRIMDCLMFTKYNVTILVGL